LIEYREESVKIIEIEYGDVRFVDYEIEAHNITVTAKEFDTKVIYTIKGIKEDLESLLAKLARVVTLK